MKSRPSRKYCMSRKENKFSKTSEGSLCSLPAFMAVFIFKISHFSSHSCKKVSRTWKRIISNDTAALKRCRLAEQALQVRKKTHFKMVFQVHFQGFWQIIFYAKSRCCSSKMGCTHYIVLHPTINIWLMSYFSNYLLRSQEAL